MKIIVGLGNPGQEYEGTRHNSGFCFVEALARKPELVSADEVLRFHTDKKFEAEIAQTKAKGEKIILVKPQTFMNLSGNSVSKLMSFFKACFEDLVIVADDKDLPLGHVRIRKDGGSAGQKGLQNIIDTLKNDRFIRIRIGIAEFLGNTRESDPTENALDTVEFVLSQFSDREIPILKKAIAETIEYILPYLGESKNEQIPDRTIRAL